MDAATRNLLADGQSSTLEHARTSAHHGTGNERRFGHTMRRSLLFPERDQLLLSQTAVSGSGCYIHKTMSVRCAEQWSVVSGQWSVVNVYLRSTHLCFVLRDLVP